MNNKKTTTQNELYVAMIGEEDLAKINTLKLRKDSKRNVQVLYGFFLTIANKPFTTANNQVTGRQWFRYVIANKLFATGYDVITKYTGIHKSQISAYVQLLEKLELIHVERTNTIEERTQRANSNSNCNSNSNYKSDYNKSIDNIEINNLKKLTMELTEKISELEEKLMETNHLVEELIESKAKMEHAIIELQTTVQECKQQKTNVEQVKSQSHHNYNEIGNFWQRWNQYKQNLKDGKTTDNYLNIYITKAQKLFNGDNLKKVVEQLKEQYAYVTSKSQSQSPLQIRELR